ncbi:MAG: hypothetical protein JWS12_651 [Candidatus Saccharibacteria bacterium]|nr:hypothetical protein [Candidatus Saccharibacteria bacterium]
MPFVTLKHELLEKDPIDLSPLNDMAQTYHTIFDTLADADERDSDLLVAEAERYIRQEIGSRLLFLTSLYAVNGEGYLTEPDVFGTIQGVRPTVFMENPVNAKSEWCSHGLGIVIEPVDDGGISSGLPFWELHGWASNWGELTLPFNNNVVLAARAPVFAHDPKE